VEKNRSLKSTYISSGTIVDVCGDRSSHMEPIAFAPGSVLVSSGETVTDSVTKPPHTTTFVTFDHILKPGDAGMGAGSSKDSKEGHAATYLVA
jgi:plastocyanin